MRAFIGTWPKSITESCETQKEEKRKEEKRKEEKNGDKKRNYQEMKKEGKEMNKKVSLQF